MTNMTTNMICPRCKHVGHDTTECIITSSARDKDGNPIIDPNDRFMHSKVDNRFINEQATEIWQLTASYLSHKDICRLATCNKYLNEEVVWGKWSHALLWRETNLITDTYMVLSFLSGMANAGMAKASMANASTANASMYNLVAYACRKRAPVAHIITLIKAINNFNPNEYTMALHWALYYEIEDVIKLLFEYGVSPNFTDLFGCSPLISATFKGNINIIDMLLKAKANIDHADNHGNTALIYACAKNKFSIAKKLLNAGAKVDIRNSYGESALDMVRRNRYDPEIGREFSEEMRKMFYQDLLTLIES